MASISNILLFFQWNGKWDSCLSKCCQITAIALLAFTSGKFHPDLRSTNNHVTFSRQGYLGSVRMWTIIFFVEIEKSRVCILRNLLRNSCIWERSLWSMVWFWPLGGVRETCCISHGWFHFFVCNFFNCFMPESSWWVNDNVICIA